MTEVDTDGFGRMAVSTAMKMVKSRSHSLTNPTVRMVLVLWARATSVKARSRSVRPSCLAMKPC